MSEPTDKRYQDEIAPEEGLSPEAAREEEAEGAKEAKEESPERKGAAGSEDEVDSQEEGRLEELEALRERVQELEAKVAELEDTAASYKDQALRAQAEGENARRRAEKDVEQARKYGLEEFLKELLPVKDSLEMALQVEVSGEENAEKLHKGVEMTASVLEEALHKHGVEEINPIEEAFDPNYHQAMATVETEDQPNRVVSVMQKGYLLNGRLVRPALVEVSVRSEEDQDEGQQGSAEAGGSSEADS